MIIRLYSMDTIPDERISVPGTISLYERTTRSGKLVSVNFFNWLRIVGEHMTIGN
jgi:hypothetical protein